MTRTPYCGFRFPKPIIEHAVWLYARFTLSLRDVEELLAERGISVSYEGVVSYPAPMLFRACSYGELLSAWSGTPSDAVRAHAAAIAARFSL